VGAHVEIGSDRVYQLVPLDHVAWHAVDANAFSVGFEHAGYGRSRAEWLDAGHELAYSANRAAWVLHQWKLGAPRYGHNVWPHSWGGVAWGNHDCPGLTSRGTCGSGSPRTPTTGTGGARGTSLRS